jgi:hypothetical protein
MQSGGLKPTLLRPGRMNQATAPEKTKNSRAGGKGIKQGKYSA